ncbi:hypothetical protein C2S53_000530 [Perilla frutescens var. hirtella]|uniref:Uncharacterized protein n=1 Tax=Perilla frutescens var. hirtella TaxID=608512 RepID=A0AAD4JK47_PERFH|nr:hypothetical protein C2S53_000530 [Perilla frutescens var. hirtella]
MAVFVSRKKPRLSKKLQADELGFFYSFLETILLRVPAAFFILVFIYIWSSSTAVLSGNIVHVCVSSRKLSNLYCLSSGTQPNFQIPAQLVDDSNTSSDNVEVVGFGIKSSILADHNSSDKSTSIPVDNNSSIPADNSSADSKSSILAVNETLEYAYREVEEQLQLHRSWISDSNPVKCEGRGIYVYELPPKFNKDLSSQCGDMIPWADFSQYLSNDGLGKKL